MRSRGDILPLSLFFSMAFFAAAQAYLRMALFHLADCQFHCIFVLIEFQVHARVLIKQGKDKG